MAFVQFSDHNLILSYSSPLFQEKLREAAKARLRRMMSKHVRAENDVEPWVLDEWKKRPQNETAQLLMDANWNKAGL